MNWKKHICLELDIRDLEVSGKNWKYIGWIFYMTDFNIFYTKSKSEKCKRIILKQNIKSTTRYCFWVHCIDIYSLYDSCRILMRVHWHNKVICRNIYYLSISDLNPIVLNIPHLEIIDNQKLFFLRVPVN